ncbi:MAG: site-2 protease family protein [Acidobacteria bacterium]|nr:site-2 protease family protein [Acidobacteriota bacterium]
MQITPPPEPSRRQWFLSASLFAATFLTTTLAGLFHAGGDVDLLTAALAVSAQPSVVLLGLPFSITLMAILLAHELGHFLACRYYGIRCTPPYFIPSPFLFAGTFGAFIRIRSPFADRRALFDVGIAGPLVGFAFVIPALAVGISYSKLIARGSLGGGITFGEPLLFRWLAKIVLGYSPATQDMIAHPIAMAGWLGLLVTCLNLLPIWQLDGGHIAYAVLGREQQRRTSLYATVGLILISFLGWPVPSYLLFGILLLVLGSRFRFYHPATLNDDVRLGRGRLLLGAAALAILLVSFTPVPVSFG